MYASILDSSKRESNKIWVDQGSEFYDSLFKKWFKDNGIKMYSTNNEGKSVFAERFVITFQKKKDFKHLTTVSKNIYFDTINY